MVLVSVIRRWYLRDGMPIWEIFLCTGLSRDTVRKYLSSQELEQAPPWCKSSSKLGSYGEALTTWLLREARLRTVYKRSLGTERLMRLWAGRFKSRLITA